MLNGEYDVENTPPLLLCLETLLSKHNIGSKDNSVLFVSKLIGLREIGWPYVCIKDKLY